MNKIFTITAGRTGIHYLSGIFVKCTMLVQTGSWEPLKEIPATDEGRKAKVDEVWETLPDPYVSTTLYPKNGYLGHLFAKGARFIHLDRDEHEVALSWARLNGVPGRTPRGLGYHPNPADRNNCLVIAHPEKLTGYALCLWLAREVRARAEYIKSLGADVFTINTPELNDPEKVEELLKWSRIPYDIMLLGLVSSNGDYRNGYFAQYYQAEPHHRIPTPTLLQRLQAEQELKDYAQANPNPHV